MSNTIRTKILSELEAKRRRAQLTAANNKLEAYANHPELIDFDKKISNTATAYTKRMIAGEDVKDEMQKEIAKIFSQKANFLHSVGLSAIEFEPKYSCKACNDTGVTDNGDCNCLKARIIEENFKNSNLGALLTNQSFDNFSLEFYPDEVQPPYPISPRANMQKNFSVCRVFASNFNDVQKSLLLTGGTGLGKTFLSTCIARELLFLGKSVVYISAVDFFKRIENSRFDKENVDIDMFFGCDLLIIDDLGTEAPSQYTTAVFSDILDRRVNMEKKLILSTNHKISDIEKLYGQRIYSRISGYFEHLLFFGKDIRVQKFLKGN